jgi:hypothetical protein
MTNPIPARAEYTDVDGHSDPISNNNLHSTILREAIADPFIARQRARWAQAAAHSIVWSEAKAAMTADLFDLMPKLAFHTRYHLRAGDMATGLEFLMGDLATGINTANSTAQIADLFRPTPDERGHVGMFLWLGDWAEPHLAKLRTAGH